MKGIAVILFVLLFSNVNSQLNESNFDPKKIRVKLISIPIKDIEKINSVFPLKDIEIADGRFDNSLGYIKSLGTGELLNLQVKNTTEIKEYLLSHFAISTSDSAYKVLCVLKKIILSNNIYIYEDGKDNKTKNEFSVKSGAIIKVDFFVAIEDRFIPLYRFDSTITGTKKISQEMAQEYLSQALTASLKKLQSIQWTTIKTKGKKYARTSIDSSINKTFDLALYNTPAKGVYNSFSDFLNNKPNTNEYSITKTAKGDFLYTKDSKNIEILRTDIWGYCDGKDFYIYSAENFFKLCPSGRSFIVYGAKDYSSSRAFRLNVGWIDLLAPNSAYAKTKTKKVYSLIHEPLILDMDTGELF
jgi:hypothetical protein